MQLNFDSKSLVFHKLAVIEFNLMLQGMERRRGAEESVMTANSAFLLYFFQIHINFTEEGVVISMSLHISSYL